MLGRIPGFDVRWGLAFGVLFCIAMYVLVRHTTWGFALRIVGGNPRAAQLAGLPHSRLVVAACFLGGAAAGLAGMVEVAAVDRTANAFILVGHRYTRLLVAFIARQNPIAITPVASLLRGTGSSPGLLPPRP